MFGFQYTIISQLKIYLRLDALDVTLQFENGLARKIMSSVQC